MNDRVAYCRNLIFAKRHVSERLIRLELEIDRLRTAMSPDETRALDEAIVADCYGGDEEPTAVLTGPKGE